MSDGTDEKMVQVVAEVPESVRDTAKENLPYGGITREIRERLQEVAFGPELATRSRLEQRREDIKEKLRGKRQERRELDAEIETLEDQIQGIDEKLSSITEQEDRYEAKLEELESQLREDGTRMYPDLPNVKRTAGTGGVEPEGVVKTLRERNPDVPDFAFENGMHDYENSWYGVEDEALGTEPDERERRYR